jgi:hypothetical protein
VKCDQEDRLLLTNQYGRYQRTDAGVEFLSIFHKLRSIAMENFHEHFKGIFDGHGITPFIGTYFIKVHTGGPVDQILTETLC